MYFDTKTNHHRFSSQRTKNESKRNGTNRNRIERRGKRILAVAQSFSLITYCFIEFGQTKALTTMTTIMMENWEKQRKGRRTEQRRGEKKKRKFSIGHDLCIWFSLSLPLSRRSSFLLHNLYRNGSAIDPRDDDDDDDVVDNNVCVLHRMNQFCPISTRV